MTTSAHVSEITTVQGGAGVLDLRGDGHDSILFVRGHPTTMHWSDGEGSIGQYLVRAGAPGSFEDDLKSIRWVADGYLLPDVPLSAQLYPLLMLFADGDYALSFLPFSGGLDILSYDGPSPNSIERFYPLNILLETRPRDSLSMERVRHFEAAIERGARPIVFVATIAGGYDVGFIIDGHHKLRAYESAGTEPPCLVIQRLAPPPTTEKEGATVLARACVDDRAYRRRKRG